jgi:hypothetical protein
MKLKLFQIGKNFLNVYALVLNMSGGNIWIGQKNIQ